LREELLIADRKAVYSYQQAFRRWRTRNFQSFGVFLEVLHGRSVFNLYFWNVFYESMGQR